MRGRTYLAAPAIRLKIDKFRMEAGRRKWVTQQQIADGIGISRPNLTKLLHAEESLRQAPGETFIAAVLHAFSNARFEDFFEVVVPSELRKSA